MRFTFWIFNADNQHVLCQPSFCACLVTGNSQGMAFLPQKCVAAVTRAEALDRQLLREVHDKTALWIQVTGLNAVLSRKTLLFRYALGPPHPCGS